jgi:hypothetical protein
MGAVVAVGLARVAEIAGVADEVVATILEAEQPQVERRVPVDVSAGGVVPGDARIDAAVHGVGAFEAEATAGCLDGRAFDVGRDGRRTGLVGGCGLGVVARWGSLDFLRLRCASDEQGAKQDDDRSSRGPHCIHLSVFPNRDHSKTGAKPER